MRINNISVVTTVYNDCDALMTLLGEMDRQSLPVNELIVVDGGSTDRTPEHLRERKDAYHFHLEYLFDGKRRNIARGFNDAIRRARNEWILIVACGNAYDDAFVQEIAAEAKRAGDDCDVIYCTVAGRETGRVSRVYNETFLGGNRPHDYRASNHGVLIKRRIFETFGYFYEGFAYAGEDTEFYERLRGNGVKMSWAKQARAVWDIPQNLSEYLKQLRIYTIADLQIFGLRYALGKSLQILALILLAVLTYFHWASGLAVIAALVLAYAWKKRTPHPSSMALFLITKLFRCFYCMKYIRYGFSEPVLRKNLRLPPAAEETRP